MNNTMKAMLKTAKWLFVKAVLSVLLFTLMAVVTVLLFEVFERFSILFVWLIPTSILSCIAIVVYDKYIEFKEEVE